MQRTAKTTRYTYAKVTIENGQTKIDVRKVDVTETDPKKAYKLAVKTIGHSFDPISTEVIETLWYMPDELWFKYATPVTKEEEPKES